MPLIDNKHSRCIAAIDLGSNSFHMVVARVFEQHLQLVSRHKQKVRLGDGLDEHNFLSESAIERGLECLKVFAERLADFELDDVKVVATHTLRKAKNANDFLDRAKPLFPFPIEIISGQEEARIIYNGVEHTQTASESKLVIDIGGGSTELVAGQGFTPLIMRSLPMGCVSFTQRFFADDGLTSQHFSDAYSAASRLLMPLIEEYKKATWDISFGSSGTAKSIKEVLIGLGFTDGLITPQRLSYLKNHLCESSSSKALNLSGLSDERKPVFAAGVIILSAVMDTLDINELHFSDAALREGVLYDMEDRFKDIDVRTRTAETLVSRYHVDVAHGQKVKVLALALLKQVQPQVTTTVTNELYDLLSWAALLHETGQSIAFQGYHRHSAYLLKHTTMPGFNTEQQRLISTLVRYQRKALKLQDLPELSLFAPQQVILLIRILRLAILLNRQRNQTPAPGVTLTVEQQDHWELKGSNSDWLIQNQLLEYELKEEQQRWKSVGWSLNLE
ncbi:exopolyphosphatase [Vibrio sp. 10N.261.46.E12]|uniref:exopolyphosphatase n=1 Tax=unclassified Vibrio TaxID=2614977 RepID=UPI0009771B96|nr:MULTISPECIES: exopolyphosphatase [unclassified Vibrio]OMO33853.1 exopolyphosphatase [Vibrio sp. 10N.261.45.E1]PMJ21214.1 exopolyphosphatase [Vibrio sp. 10N.286.45.B6]PML92933.1 exopolyphosphatase [Vibrio sp. 10N.261.49.E11]PMM73027.1 exopolyphosphatase [Vibrio sp. 10N.261.46.F12]PMM80882.1 exopolyphosphatase [Vibrio sp. 10N.261.46.E8]